MAHSYAHSYVQRNCILLPIIKYVCNFVEVRAYGFDELQRQGCELKTTMCSNQGADTTMGFMQLCSLNFQSIQPLERFHRGDGVKKEFGTKNMLDSQGIEPRTSSNYAFANEASYP